MKDKIKDALIILVMVAAILFAVSTAFTEQASTECFTAQSALPTKC